MAAAQEIPTTSAFNEAVRQDDRAAAQEIPTTSAPNRKKEEKVRKSPEQRYEQRKHLLQFLLIGLVGVSIAYVGLEFGIGCLLAGLWIVGRITGTAA
jgi:hypothetical protein